MATPPIDSHHRVWRRFAAEFLGMALALVGITLYFGFTTDHFLTTANFLMIANQIPSSIFVAVGMTFVIIYGGIDLSVGSVLAFSSAMLGYCLVNLGLPLPVAILGALAVGSGCGYLNGWIVTRWQLPSFIVTLGMLEAARGAAYLVTDSQTIYIGKQVEVITTPFVFGLSYPILIALLTVVAGQFVLTRTSFGRYVVAAGYNEDVAYRSGINTKRIGKAVFLIGGLLTAVGALVETARFSSSDPNAGIGLELEAIAAVVIGGTSLSGGRGSVVRTLFGVLIIAVLRNGLAAAGAEEYVKRLITGFVIVAAIILDQYRQKRS